MQGKDAALVLQLHDGQRYREGQTRYVRDWKQQEQNDQAGRA